MAATIDRTLAKSRKENYDKQIAAKNRHGSYYFVFNDFLHSTVPADNYNHIRPSIHHSLYLHETKNLVVHLNKFRELCRLNPNYTHKNLKYKFNKVISELVSLPFENISYSLTHEDSIFFVLQKNEFEFHLNYFFNEGGKNEFEEEAILMTYKNNEKQPSIADYLNFILDHLRTITHPKENEIYWGF